MNKLNIFICAVVLMAAACITGCKKENQTTPDNSFRISIAEYKGETKSYINGFFTEWENGDAVILGVNSATGISADLNVTYPLGSMTATTSVAGFTPATGDDVWGAYPASLFSGKALGKSVAITLPDSYDYVTAFGHQTLAAPMVGHVTKTSGVDELVFRHACAILKITVAAAAAYTLDEIQLVATNSAGDTNIQLSGGTTVNCQTGALGAWTSGSSANNTITLNMSGNRAALNEDRAFYVPVPPLANGTKIEIRLHNYEDDKWTVVSATTTAAIAGHTLSSFSPISVTGGTNDYIFYDYLENDGSAYIDLGVKPDNTSKMEMVFKAPRPGGSQYYSGSAPHDGTRYFGISGSSSDRCLCTHFMDEYIRTTGVIERYSGNKYRVTAEIKESATNSGYYYLSSTFEELSSDGSIIHILSKDSGEYSGGLPVDIPTLLVFGMRQETFCPGLKLYSYRVWKSGALDFNFVPAKRVSDGVFGLYNMVDKTFKVKTLGGGSFNAGND